MDNSNEHYYLASMVECFPELLYLPETEKSISSYGYLPTNIEDIDDFKNHNLIKLSNDDDLEVFFKELIACDKHPEFYKFFLVPATNFDENIRELQEAGKNNDNMYLKTYGIDAESFLKQRAEMQNIGDEFKNHNVLVAQVLSDLYLTEIDEYGSVRGDIPAKIENVSNPKVIKFDNQGVQGDFLEDLFGKTLLQNSGSLSDIKFFVVPIEKFEQKMQPLREAVKFYNKNYIWKHGIDAQSFLNQRTEARNEAQKPQLDKPIELRHVNWAQFEQIGVTRETLEKTGNLEKMLNWQKSDLMPINAKIDGYSTPFNVDARLSFRKMPEDYLTVSIHLLRKAPELERPYYGVKFSEEDKKNLLTTGNLGRVVEAEYSKGVKTPVFLSIDKQTNQLVSFRAAKVKIPETIKGVTLSDLQKKELSEGKPIYVANMTDKNGKPFNARIQFNADKKGLEFRFENNRHNQSQSQNQNQRQDNKDLKWHSAKASLSPKSSKSPKPKM